LRLPLDPSRTAGALWEAMASELGRTPDSDEEAAFAADHLFYLPDDLLLKEDRTTMGASVEGRVPFLDPALVRYAAGLSLDSRMRGGEGKHLLRAIAARHLPADIAARRKHGFSVPIESWLRGPLMPLARDVFAGEGSGVFDPAMLRRWLDEHAAHRDRSGPLWAALSFELWWRTVGGARPAELEALGRPRSAGAVAGTAL
jgi:asparagine synthase (glutamine-hydrolysing)